jgi:hypothetical protein
LSAARLDGITDAAGGAGMIERRPILNVLTHTVLILG